MRVKLSLLPLLLLITLLTSACGYIVLPECWEEAQKKASGAGWSAVATEIGEVEGGLRIALTLRNNTGDWSAMQATPGKPATLTAGGKSVNCDTVQVSSGGHRLAPGFQMRGFTGGTKAAPETQLVYVECKGATLSSGAKLTINYTYVTGQYNYYEPEANQASGVLEVNLDEIATGLTYPIAEVPKDLIQKPDVEIVALNKVVLTLTSVTRDEKGLRFSWKTSNPGAYPTYVHIGNPPVIGADGIIYGLYETPDLASVPISPAGGTTEWTTETAVPPDVKGLYILLSVESGKQRLYANYAIDISQY
ncbi:MAG TPA: hypothetical protein PLJ78_05955 [Anaerolineae bacterium]|nr:hypothetical protein [Anaerolineae bacterium]HQK13469.1 hypothetical protein [Anaerolineae bacterium]